MVRFLIAAHGKLAEGFRSSVSIIMGEESANKIEVMNCFTEGGTDNPKVEIEKICTSVKPDDQLILFTDLMNGSVNQFSVPFAVKPNIFIISGINFPLIIEMIAEYTFGIDEKKVNSSDIRIMIEKAKNEIKFVNDEIIKDEKEEDFFKK